MLRSGRISCGLAAILIVGSGVSLAATAGSAAALTTAPTTKAELGPNADPLPYITGSSWILVDGETGNVLAERDPDRQLPPASTLKTLTAQALLPRLIGDSQYMATYQDVNQRGTKVGIRAGESYTVNDLVKGMLIKSGNDTASALANAYGGWDAAMTTMNAEAARLGATNTHVDNPSGLDDNDQLTTARDLAIIFREAIKNPEIREIFSYKTAQIPSQGRMLNLVSYDRLLHEDYPGIVGAKLGFTPGAGRTLVVAAQRSGHTLILAAMRHGERMDHIGQTMLDWGFANRDRVTPVGRIADPGPPAQFTPRPALQVNPDGTPLSGQEQVLNQIASGDSAASPESEQADSGGPSWLTIIAWIFIIGLGFLVIFRVRAAIIEKRAATRHRDAPTDVDLTGDFVSESEESRPGRTRS